MTRRWAFGLATGIALLTAIAGCGSSGHHTAPPPPAATTTTSTSVAGVQTSGVRTVLSPVGLNVRAQPDRAAKVLGTAAQAVVLTVLGHTGGSGGWFQVKGATVTGWITDNPTLSASGEFRSYVSGVFSALYPAAWTSSDISATTAVFRSGTGPDNIVSDAAASVTRLPAGRPDYGQSSSQPIVVCGVTSILVVYQYNGPTTTTTTTTVATPAAGPTAPLPYLAQVRLTPAAHHALGFYANLTDDGAQLQIFRQFLASVTFPSPQCTG